MNEITLFLIAVALALDSCAVSIVAGATIQEKIWYYGLRAAVIFGLFQGGMPVAGYLIGEAGSGLIDPYGYLVAFLLLLLIGGKMCYESLWGDGSEPGVSITSFSTVVVLAIATSIDALAAGVTFAVLQIPILHAAVVIGVVTTAASLAGIWGGRTFGPYLGKRVELVGGLILIGIGLNILFEGLAAGA